MISLLKGYVKNLCKWIEFKSVDRTTNGKYCVFQCKGGAPGLFSYLISSLGFIRYAHKHNLQPIIDLQSFKNTYLAETNIGFLNAWDYYFEQPQGVKLSDIDISQCEIFDINDPQRNGQLQSPWWDWGCLYPETVTYKMWHAYAQRYIKYSPNAKQVIEETYKKLFSTNDRVLGIQCRGTDYTRHKPKAHPIQPSPEMVMEKAEQLLREKKYNKIFLATEDGVVYRKFVDKFGDIVISSDKTHVDYDGDSWINGILPSEQQAKLDHGMDYLVSMAMLTKCDAFIAGKTSGSVGVMLLSNGFEYSYFWELGYYE